MSTVKIATSKLTALANAVRSKSGESDSLTLNDISNIIPSLATPAVPPTWADGTWEEIAQALSDHKSGKIDLYTTPGWEIGATRTVPLSAMAATGVSESHIAQDVEIVLTDKDVYDLSDGSGKCIFTWDLKNCLANKGYMNPSGVNNGGWNSSARRTWCNNVFYNALPASFKALVPQVKVKASAGNKSSTITTSNDYCFLRSEIEVTGSVNKSYAGEGVYIKYYETQNNRLKGAGNDMFGNPEHSFWERSPNATDSTLFCICRDGTNLYSMRADYANALAPCGCI